MEPDKDYLDIELRPAEMVARRCIVLAALLQLATFDLDGAGITNDDPETAAFDLREWLRSQDLWRELTPTEAEYLARPIAQRSAAATPDPLSLGESFATLAWALGIVPAMDPLTAADIQDVIFQVPEPWESTQSWLHSQRLRPETEIVVQRESTELWEWRLSTELARRDAPERERAEIDASVSEVAGEGVAAGLLREDATHHDLEMWKTISQRTSDEITSHQAMAEQRLKALNWVCGFGETWDDVPLEV